MWIKYAQMRKNLIKISAFVLALGAFSYKASAQTTTSTSSSNSGVRVSVGVDAGIPHRDVEDVVAPDLGKIVQADVMAGHADPGVGNRQQNAVKKGIGNKERKQCDCRQHQAEGQPALVLEQARDRPAFRGGNVPRLERRGCNRSDRRHQRFLPIDSLRFGRRSHPWSLIERYTRGNGGGAQAAI